jgi:hypothetical protein
MLSIQNLHATVADKPIRCETDENLKQLCLVRAH